MTAWFSPLCTASAEPLSEPCSTSADGQHWCSDWPSHKGLHTCLCLTEFTDRGLVRVHQDRSIA